MEFFRKLGLDKWFRPRRFGGGGDTDRLRIPPHYLWESAQRAKQRGQNGQESSMVAHVVSRARRQSGLTVEALAQKSGLSLDDVVDLNLGTLSLSQATSLVERLKEMLPIDEKLYRVALLEDSKKEQPF